jgi:lysozyme
MRTGKNGIELIKKYEGFSNIKYKCSAGYPTIGFGHKLLPGEKFDAPITVKQGEAILKVDLIKAERCVNENVHCDLTQNEFDALVSLVFNIGCGAFRGSTLLLQLNKFVAHDKVALQFLRWNKIGTKVSAGLTNRRQAEMELFLS